MFPKHSSWLRQSLRLSQFLLTLSFEEYWFGILWNVPQFGFVLCLFLMTSWGYTSFWRKTTEVKCPSHQVMARTHTMRPCLSDVPTVVAPHPFPLCASRKKVTTCSPYIQMRRYGAPPWGGIYTNNVEFFCMGDLFHWHFILCLHGFALLLGALRIFLQLF